MSINEISTLSILAPILVGAIFFTKLQRASRTLLLYTLATLIMDCYMWFLSNRSTNTMFLFHIHSYIEFGFIALIYFRITKDIRHVNTIKIVASLFAVASVINVFFFEPITEFNSNQRYFESALVLIVILPYLFQLRAQESNVLRTPFGLMSVALIIYFVGTLAVFILSKELFSSSAKNYLWIIHALLNIGLNLCYAVVLFKSRQLSP